MNDIFNKLYIFEMANNHQGKLSHGKAIIDYLKVNAPFWKIEKQNNKKIYVKSIKKDENKIKINY